MKLQDTLDKMKEKFEAGLPPEIKAVMHQATDDLGRSGIMENVLQPGSRLPAFTLPDEHDNTVSSPALVEQGPVVITFYRGVW